MFSSNIDPLGCVVFSTNIDPLGVLFSVRILIRWVCYVLMVEGMYVVVNVMLSLISVMSPPPAMCNLSLRIGVKLCTLGVLALGVSLVS